MHFLLIQISSELKVKYDVSSKHLFLLFNVFLLFRLFWWMGVITFKSLLLKCGVCGSCGFVFESYRYVTWPYSKTVWKFFFQFWKFHCKTLLLRYAALLPTSTQNQLIFLKQDILLNLLPGHGRLQKEVFLYLLKNLNDGLILWQRIMNRFMCLEDWSDNFSGNFAEQVSCLL